MLLFAWHNLWDIQIIMRVLVPIANASRRAYQSRKRFLPSCILSYCASHSYGRNVFIPVKVHSSAFE